MKVREGYVNKQFSILGLEYKEIKQLLEEAEGKSSKINERVVTLTNELAQHSERLDELKESFESKDSGMHDTSPLVRIKAALQQIKKESYAFDLRIGVVSHALLGQKISMVQVGRQAASKHAKRRQQKGRKHTSDDNSSGDDYDN